MSRPRRPVSEVDSSNCSAFPALSEDLSQLPEIPGGWTNDLFEFDHGDIRLLKPANPDLFLDDDDVMAANEVNDYMPYWAFLWPSSVKMASLVHRAPWQRGASVLELGAGLGLVGLASMMRGDVVTFSDYDATALYMCRKNAIANDLTDPPVMQLDWRYPSNERFEAIIGCEVTYDATMHCEILEVLNRMLADDGVCWLGDPGRYQSPFFYRKAQKAGFEVRIFDEHLARLSEPLSVGFQILELRKINP